MFVLTNKKIVLFWLVFLFCFFAKITFAANLYVKPSQSEVSVGNIVNVQVVVDTAGKFINNAESIIQFPSDLLEVVSLDNKSSIFSLWVENPSFSNSVGQIMFNGGVPNPGFQGGNGDIISIVFRTKKVGTASIIFSNSAVRENDGLGTDILSNQIGAKINIRNATDSNQPISGFAITSTSHPNQNSWYNKKDVDLSWNLPKNATAVKTLLGAYPDSEPTVYYDSPINKKNIKNLEDGIWYFHASYLAGDTWSKVAHYKLQIDTVSPTNLKVTNQKDDNGRVVLNLKAEDSLSGIDHYQVVADSDQPISVKSDVNGEVTTEVPFSRAGQHLIKVIVFDKAGNQTDTKLEVTTDFVAELRIDSYPAKIKVNESIEVSGTAPYPYTNLRVLLKNSDNVVEVYKLKSDSHSNFYFKSQPVLTQGNYTLWAEMLKENDEVSLTSNQVKILVEKPLLLQIGSYTIGLMKVLVPAIALTIIFLLMVIYGWYQLFSLYRKVKKESVEAEKTNLKSFGILHKDLANHILKLKRIQSKRQLTDEEIEFLEQFDEELMDAKNAIDKEIGDISR
jgi:hypothetical protein